MWWDGDVLTSVERYTPGEDRWTNVSPMLKRRSALGAAVVGDYIFAVGGMECGTPLSSVERYDPTTDRWSNVAEMSVPRGAVAVAALQGVRSWGW